MRFLELPDEIGLSIVVTGSKGEIPKFQRILNAFSLNYAVLMEMDGHDDQHRDNAAILDNLGGNRIARMPNKLENLVGHAGHFKDQPQAKKFFSDINNINTALETVLNELLPQPA
jgi:hypothetical protein